MHFLKKLKLWRGPHNPYRSYALAKVARGPPWSIENHTHIRIIQPKQSHNFSLQLQPAHVLLCYSRLLVARSSAPHVRLAAGGLLTDR
jgi:hypothetical protein